MAWIRIPTAQLLSCAKGTMTAQLPTYPRQSSCGRRFHACDICALARLANGQHEKYRQDCRELLDRFSTSQGGDNAYWVAWTCAIVPDAVADWSIPITLAERAAGGDPKSPSLSLVLTDRSSTVQEGWRTRYESLPRPTVSLPDPMKPCPLHVPITGSSSPWPVAV